KSSQSSSPVAAVTRSTLAAPQDRLMPITLMNRAAHSAAISSAAKQSPICQPRLTSRLMASGPTKEPSLPSPMAQPTPVERMALEYSKGASAIKPELVTPRKKPANPVTNIEIADPQQNGSADHASREKLRHRHASGPLVIDDELTAGCN